MKRTTIGIDLAENLFEIYVDHVAKQVVARKRLARMKMAPWLPIARRLWWGWKPVAEHITGRGSSRI